MLKDVRNSLILSLGAGVMIGIGGTVNLALCAQGKNVEGAIFFAVALLTICYLGLHLFTGRVGYIVNSKKVLPDIVLLITCIVGNLVGTAISGIVCGEATPAIIDIALNMCEGKLERSLLSTVASAFMCGILMYVAVAIFKERNSIAGIVFCVPVFILSGYEHSIADMFYFFAAGMISVDAVIFIITVVIGNSAGGMFFATLRRLASDNSAEK